MKSCFAFADGSAYCYRTKIARARIDDAIMKLYRWYLRASDHVGKLRILRLWQRWLFPHGARRAIDTSQGFRCFVGSEDEVEHTILVKGTYEEETLQFIKQNLSWGDCAVYSGTAYGFHMIIASSVVGPTGLVFGIDPQPENLYRTFENLRLNKCTANCRLICSALSNQRDLLPFAAPNRSNHGSTSIAARRDQDAEDYISYATPFGDLMQQLNVSSVRLLVLDVEGHEWEVITSLGAAKPDIVVFEIHPWFIENTGLDPSKIFEAFNEQGYRVRCLDGRNVPEDLRDTENNFVASLSGADVKFVSR